MQVPGPPPSPVELESWRGLPSNLSLFSQAVWVNVIYFKFGAFVIHNRKLSKVSKKLCFKRYFCYRLPRWLYQFTFPPAVQEGSLFSTPSPAFIVCRLFDEGHSDQCEEVISHCSFDLHFSNNEQC